MNATRCPSRSVSARVPSTSNITAARSGDDIFGCWSVPQDQPAACRHGPTSNGLSVRVWGAKYRIQKTYRSALRFHRQRRPRAVPQHRLVRETASGQRCVGYCTTLCRRLETAGKDGSSKVGTQRFTFCSPVNRWSSRSHHRLRHRGLWLARRDSPRNVKWASSPVEDRSEPGSCRRNVCKPSPADLSRNS